MIPACFLPAVASSSVFSLGMKALLSRKHESAPLYLSQSPAGTNLSSSILNWQSKLSAAIEINAALQSYLCICSSSGSEDCVCVCVWGGSSSPDHTQIGLSLTARDRKLRCCKKEVTGVMGAKNRCSLKLISIHLEIRATEACLSVKKEKAWAPCLHYDYFHSLWQSRRVFFSLLPLRSLEIGNAALSVSLLHFGQDQLSQCDRVFIQVYIFIATR